MLIMPIREGDNIEKTLKKFKRKVERTGVIKQLRARQAFVKPSVENRLKRQKAVYVAKLRREQE